MYIYVFYMYINIKIVGRFFFFPCCTYKMCICFLGYSDDIRIDYLFVLVGKVLVLWVSSFLKNINKLNVIFLESNY